MDLLNLFFYLPGCLFVQNIKVYFFPTLPVRKFCVPLKAHPAGQATLGPRVTSVMRA